ncbi:MAG: inorganic diphosphatase [Bacilli bacterium]|nr:inorganic diphosphatase [Bacilli bacterium]
MNILHAISKARIKPEKFLACIEIPAGSKNKYELDEESGALILDRILYTSTHYPQNYGFIPRTWSTDDDPLDVLVICSEPIVPLALVQCYPVGVLEMTDSGEVDEKIIAICAHDPVYNSFKDINDLPKHILDEIEHFFKVYKELEFGKQTIVDKVYGVEKAKEVIQKCINRYADKFE